MAVSEPLRVAAIIPTESISGPGRQLAALAEQLNNRNVDFRVLLFQRRGTAPTLYATFLEGRSIAYEIIRDRGPLDTRMIGEAAEVLRSWQPRVVQTHGYKATALAYVLHKRGLPWRWIGVYHGATTESWRARVYHWLDRRMMASADAIVVPSRAQARQFTHARQRVRVIHNAIVPRREQSTAAAPAQLLSKDAPLVGVVGRLSREKGVDIFLRACALLRSRNVAFSAAIVGDGPDHAFLHRLRQKLRLADHVRFLGRIDELTGFYRDLDLLVIPSRSEGLPNVLLEALHADVSVVATAVGAIPDVLRLPAAGCVVPPNSSRLLADAIEHALHSHTPGAPDARRQTVARFSLEHRVDEHVRLYEELRHASFGDSPAESNRSL